MSETTPANPKIEVFPHVDIIDSAANGLIIPLQNDTIFNLLHDECHKTSRLFTVGHSAVQITANAALDDKPREDALLMGCEVFEIISTAVRPENYQTEAELLVVFDSAKRMTDQTNVEWFTQRATNASQRLKQDAPTLYEMVKEIATRRLGHDGTVLEYAIAGAGIMRGLQIRTDRYIAA